MPNQIAPGWSGYQAYYRSLMGSGSYAPQRSFTTQGFTNAAALPTGGGTPYTGPSLFGPGGGGRFNYPAGDIANPPRTINWGRGGPRVELNPGDTPYLPEGELTPIGDPPLPGPTEPPVPDTTGRWGSDPGTAGGGGRGRFGGTGGGYTPPGAIRGTPGTYDYGYGGPTGWGGITGGFSNFGSGGAFRLTGTNIGTVAEGTGEGPRGTVIGVGAKGFEGFARGEGYSRPADEFKWLQRMYPNNPELWDPTEGYSQLVTSQASGRAHGTHGVPAFKRS